MKGKVNLLSMEKDRLVRTVGGMTLDFYKVEWVNQKPPITGEYPTYTVHFTSGSTMELQTISEQHMLEMELALAEWKGTPAIDPTQHQTVSIPIVRRGF